MSDSNSTSQSDDTSPTWTQPPWQGWIETTGDALLIFEAARRGLIPRVTRRLVESERKMITSGSVFVFDEAESGIKRWTDGFFWSPSRILGNFLLYRETEKRGAALRSKSGDRSVETNTGDNHQEPGRNESTSLSRPKGESVGIDRARERCLVGSLTNSYKFKPGGMVKKVLVFLVRSICLFRPVLSQTFSLTIEGVTQHLISYYKVEDVEEGRLRSPSSLPEIASLDISPEYLDKQHFRVAPKIEICFDGKPRYRGEADEIDHSVDGILSSPLSTGVPLITDGRNGSDSDPRKRGKRYDPYGSPGKRGRKTKRSNSTIAEHQSLPETHPKPTLTVSVPHSSGSPSQQSPQRFQSPPNFPPSHVQSPQLPTSFTSSSPGYHQGAPSTVMSPVQYPSMGIPPSYPVVHGYHVATYPGTHPYPAIGPPQSTADSPVATQTPSTPAPTQSQLSYPHYVPDSSQPPMYYYPTWNGYGGWHYPGGYQNGSGPAPNTSPPDGINNSSGQPPGGNSEEGTDPTTVPT